MWAREANRARKDRGKRLSSVHYSFFACLSVFVCCLSVISLFVHLCLYSRQPILLLSFLFQFLFDDDIMTVFHFLLLSYYTFKNDASYYGSFPLSGKSLYKDDYIINIILIIITLTQVLLEVSCRSPLSVVLLTFEGSVVEGQKVPQFKMFITFLFNHN